MKLMQIVIEQIEKHCTLCEFNVDCSYIDKDTELCALDFDSLDVIEVIMSVEDELDMLIEESEGINYEHVKTIGDLAGLFNEE